MFDHPLPQLYLSCCDCVFFPQSSRRGNFEEKNVKKKRETETRNIAARAAKGKEREREREREREHERERFAVESGEAFLVCSRSLFCRAL